MPVQFHWVLFLRVQSIASQHWLREWLGAKQVSSHYLNQWWLSSRMHASHGLNELTHWSLGNLNEILNKQFLSDFQWLMVEVICCEIALRGMPLDITGDKSTLVQVMAWCHQATSHYLSQCWPRYLLLYGVTRPQWVEHALFQNQNNVGSLDAVPQCAGNQYIPHRFIHTIFKQNRFSD